MTDYGKSDCAWCGKPIQNIFNLMEVGNGVIHETCYWKWQADWVNYWTEAFIEELEELEKGTNRTVQVNDRARP